MFVKIMICAGLSLSFCTSIAYAQTNGVMTDTSPIKNIGRNILGGPTASQIASWQATVKPSLKESDRLEAAGRAAMRGGRYADAEASFRAALAVEPNWGPSYQGLAEALTAQGRINEAMDTYHHLIYPPGNSVNSTANDVRTDMSYAILLCQTGQWPEAVSIYNRGLRDMPGGDTPSPVLQFAPTNPQPKMMEAAAHLALGIDASVTYDWDGVLDNGRALTEYSKAMQFAPIWDTAKYYYAYGMKRLGRLKEARDLFSTLAESATDPSVKAVAHRDAR